MVLCWFGMVWGYVCILIKRETFIGIFRFLGAGYWLAAQLVAFGSVATWWYQATRTFTLTYRHAWGHWTLRIWHLDTFRKTAEKHQENKIHHCPLILPKSIYFPSIPFKNRISLKHRGSLLLPTPQKKRHRILRRNPSKKPYICIKNGSQTQRLNLCPSRWKRHRGIFL